MSEKIDARPAAFIAAWDLIKQANQLMEEAHFSSGAVAELLLRMADVYCRLAGVPESVGVEAAQRIIDRDEQSKLTDEQVAEAFGVAKK